MNYKLIMGSNIITYCDAALYVENIQVFRFYTSTDEGLLIVDFDLRDGAGNKLVVISKSEIIYAVDGFVFKELPRESYVENGDGKIVAHVKDFGSNSLALEGEFHVEDYKVSIESDRLTAGGVRIVGNILQGYRRAVKLNKGSVALGIR